MEKWLLTPLVVNKLINQSPYIFCITLEFSNISIPEFESTAIPWAKLEPISNYFKSTDICEGNFTFGILEKNLDLTSNFSINPDHMPASIYKCISEKHFSIQPCHSNPEDHIVALLKDHSKNGTFVNEIF